MLSKVKLQRSASVMHCSDLIGDMIGKWVDPPLILIGQMLMTGFCFLCFPSSQITVICGRV